MVDVSHFEALVGKHVTSPRRVPHGSVGQLVALLDFTTVTSTCVVSGLAYNQLLWSQPIGDVTQYIGLGVISGTIFVLLSRPLYRTNALASFFDQLMGVSLNWVVVLLMLCLMFFLLKVGAYHSR